MKNPVVRVVRKVWHQALRKAFASFPRSTRFAIYRSFVDCDPEPDRRLTLKIAETTEELSACFRLLHDAYVSSGFMKPDPSGMRVTLYHALPTTTTLCALYDGEVVGTMSLIRESVFGFPLQAVFDLTEVREKKGNIAEVSALAVHPKFRKTGGAILFPLMKFMYEYCTTFFDTRHLVIAVNPNRIEMYESLLFFERLKESSVDNYDFANGAPAVGASLDLYVAPQIFKQAYSAKPARKNLHAYFTEITLANIVIPNRRYFVTNDPVMTPPLLDHFFNHETQVFSGLDDRKKVLLHSIYNTPEYSTVLPTIPKSEADQHPMRKHRRYSMRCPGNLSITEAQNAVLNGAYPFQVIELSQSGFQAYSPIPLPLNVWGEATVHLGKTEVSKVRAMAVRDKTNGFNGFYGFQLEEADLVWRKCVSALEAGQTHEDLENATMFMQSRSDEEGQAAE